MARPYDPYLEGILSLPRLLCHLQTSGRIRSWCFHLCSMRTIYEAKAPVVSSCGMKALHYLLPQVGRNGMMGSPIYNSMLSMLMQWDLA